MTDSFGDGWNGNVLTIGDATFTETGTEGSGSVGDCSVVAGCTDASACNYNSDAMMMMVHVHLLMHVIHVTVLSIQMVMV